MTQEERRKGSIWVRKLEAALKEGNLQNKTSKAIDPCIVEKVHELRNAGKLYGEIGKILNMSPKTVQKYLDKEKAPSTTAMAKGSTLKS